jgi:hypothetical protein
VQVLAKSINGRLLCQPTGATGDDPDQFQMFDSRGNLTGTVDMRTGELHEPGAVAARIGGA